MINLPKLTDFDVSNKRVLVRLDLDVDEDYSRIEAAKDTLNFLKGKSCKIIILGHKGRPVGDKEKDRELSLQRLEPVIEKITDRNVDFVDGWDFGKIRFTIEQSDWDTFVLLENLRFHPGEEANDPGFVRQLSESADFYVDEAFAVAHRDHASITGLPKVLPHAPGLRFAKEVEVLSKVMEKPDRPVIAVISGVKADKIERIESMLDKVDKVLIAGRLPIYLDQELPQNQDENFSDKVKAAIPRVAGSDKVIIGNLTPDTLDITLHSVEKFKEYIYKAGTIILAGVPGKYEDEGHRQGTQEVFEAIANSKAFKVAGGGDAEAAITLLGLNEKFDWISVGGGAALEFMAKGTLPGIEVLST